LKNSSAETEEANDHEQPSGNHKSTRYSYEWGLVGGLIIGAGMALLRLSMELFYKADKASRFSPAAWVIFLIGGAAIVHGLIYACTGINGLRDLYFL